MKQRPRLAFATTVSIVAVIGLSGCKESEQARTERAQKLAIKKAAEQQQVILSNHPNSQAITAIEALGGTVKLDKTSPQQPVVEVMLSGPRVTDAGMVHLRELSELKWLGVTSTGVTDAGLVHVSGLTKLRMLNLDSTPISDTGLEHLANLSELDVLALISTQVSDAGLGKLQGLTKLRFLGLDDTQVSDAGLVHLHKLTSLRRLYLSSTRVTDAGVKALKETLPQCHVQR